MHRYANRAALVRQRPSDALPDPPCGIGRKPVTQSVFETLRGLDQTEVALLDQIQKRNASIRVALRNRDHQPQIGLDHVTLRAPAILERFLQLLVNFKEFRHRHAHELFERSHPFPLAAGKLVMKRRIALQLGASSGTFPELLPDILGDRCHFLDDLLFEAKGCQLRLNRLLNRRHNLSSIQL